MICCFNPSHHTGSDPEICFQLAAFRVSIHAPYAGSDTEVKYVCSNGKVSIHAPYAGSDKNRDGAVAVRHCFNPRPLCRERHEAGYRFVAPYIVSIHAPYAGSDRLYRRKVKRKMGFNPRPLCRERQQYLCIGGYGSGFQSTPPMQGAT